jgi:hypothetical protein
MLKDTMSEIAALVSLMLFGACVLVWAEIIEVWARH